MPPRLIVLEGAEGVGKSTQHRRLASRLAAGGAVVSTWREPGGTTLGDAVRGVLLDPASEIDPLAEALLFMASRAQLVATRIRPALERGEVVLLDRFFLSTYAYQAAGRGLDAQVVRQLNAVAAGGLVPDLTLLMVLPEGQGLARAGRRGRPDRMEAADAGFHARVEGAFREFGTDGWQALHPECGPIVPVDASGSQDQVAARIEAAVAGRWPGSFP
jgi:dTMP kinase